ncbi:hypothetical protein [Variovorax sp. Root411]|uniref:hypothetical protein n=1 Tax=Variovorax sp. Root411 TaxID=1736530 RepID=UPI0012FB747F|nr:hypothetical protein [Variovorax sp. Root411]
MIVVLALEIAQFFWGIRELAFRTKYEVTEAFRIDDDDVVLVQRKSCKLLIGLGVTKP